LRGDQRERGDGAVAQKDPLTNAGRGDAESECGTTPYGEEDGAGRVRDGWHQERGLERP
jgi:hypothetical protein